MKVTIAGAGNVGVSIASDLKDAGHHVLVIEQDADLVAKLRPTLDVSWYEGDACEVSTLHHAGMADSDVVVAATATTRTIWWYRCWPSRSSLSPGSWPGGTTARTSGGSTSHGVSTCRCRPRIC